MHDVRAWYVPGHGLGEPTRYFIVQHGILSRIEKTEPPLDQSLQRVIIGMPKTSKCVGGQLHYVAKLTDDIALTKGFTWKDGKGIFDTSSTHLKSLLNPTPDAAHVGIQKWSRNSNWTPS